ncbi:anthranilate synthase component I [Thalassospira sp. MCCC 1A01428]|uniref:anthranilate synthase component I n=1 Tax=Thalassospira sp. MCCC 1A01428 TaxID=1470575 RepID=UPI000A1F55E7|nr:anthranilate synthase component I [Thalassospira sp. MCCC 1A01428]OSQ35288.1 anthranilate synthase component I [Thalassospira sp. MCCC 1A01428]
MDIKPDFASFTRNHENGIAQVVYTSLTADLDTPVSAFLKLAEGLPNTYLLESVEGGASRGRYSFIGFKPDLIWRCFGDKAEINRRVMADADAFIAQDEKPLDALKSLISESHINLPDHLPPMSAGLVGYMGYDTVRLMEKLPDNNPDNLDVPDGIFIRPTVTASFDTIADTVTVVTPVRPESGIDAAAAYDLACARLNDVVQHFQRNLFIDRRSRTVPQDLPEPQVSVDEAGYYDMVEKAKEYIRAGDIFQVVLSQRYSLPYQLPPFAFYRALRRINPSPFMFYLDIGGFQVVGASPEILVRLRDGEVTIRPIAGTRKRGKNSEEDKALAKDLLDDPKERSEHLMLLDLGRNDVGRVSKPGTVRVTDRETIEYYSHVMHIVSNVVGQIDPQYDAMDALKAGFPAGTVSGAPKVRAMEIIDELEPVRRGIYAGCIGYISADGSMDTCIALRTAVIKDEVIHIQAGAGIVVDSKPDMEHQECRNKAGALMAACREAHRFA